MKHLQRMLLTAGCAAFLAMVPGRAGAQTSSDAAAQAQVLYEQARDDMNAGRYTEACPRLAESNRLDPGAGTQYRLAECYEHTGKLATAWSLYKDVEAASRQAGKKEREEKARESAAALEARLPKIQVVVAPKVAKIPGLEVKRNDVLIGAPSWGTTIPVDLGTQRILAMAPGKKVWERSFDVIEGKITEVHIDVLEDVPAPPPPVGPATGGGPADNAPRPRLAAIIAAGATGLLGIAAGSALGVTAQSRWDDSKQGCKQVDSTGKPFRQTCTQAAQDTGSEAEVMAHGATAAFVVGGVGLAVAGVLALLPQKSKSAPQQSKATARRAEWSACPAITNQYAGVVVIGKF